MVSALLLLLGVAARLLLLLLLAVAVPAAGQLGGGSAAMRATQHQSTPAPSPVRETCNTHTLEDCAPLLSCCAVLCLAAS